MLGARAWVAVCAWMLVACGSADEAAAPRSAGATTGVGAGVGGGGAGSSGAGGAGPSGSGHGGGGGEALGAPYPIVLAHGFFGFEEFAGLDFATYFYGVREALGDLGEDVYTPAVDPFNDSEARGAQLLAHVEQIVAATGRAKVNLIGHSQGGLDARYVAHMRPDLVASVTTFATPHGGTPVADIALQIVDDPNLASVLDWIVQVVGAPLYDEVGNETSLAAAFHALSSEGVAAFNAVYTDRQGVRYASLAGRSDMHAGGEACEPDVLVPFVTDFDGELDPVDPLLDLTEALLDGGFGDPYPNDGLVRAESARHGEFWGCVPADHLDQVGQLFGDSPGFGNDWEHQAFYASLVDRIRAEGF